MKEKKNIILLESHKIFLSLAFLKTEETECLTDYGKGILNGLLDPATFHQMPVVLKSDYDKLEKQVNDLKNKNKLLEKNIEEKTKELNRLKVLNKKRGWFR